MSSLTAINEQLKRIADAFDRAYPQHPRVDQLFGDPKADPVEFVMDYWGETYEDATKIVATTKPEKTNQPYWRLI